MQTTTISPPLCGDVRHEDAANLRVVLLYEDFPTGARAMKSYDHIVAQAGSDFEIDLALWRTDVLAVPDLCALAVGQAGQADILVVSLHDGVPPSLAVTEWFDQWLMHRHARGGALVALLDNVDGAAASALSTYSYLREIARRGEMDFFTHAGKVPRESETDSFREIATRAGTVTSVLEGIMHQHGGPPRWVVAEQDSVDSAAGGMSNSETGRAGRAAKLAG